FALQSRVPGATLADLPRQGQRQRADGLGSEAGHDDVQGRERSAGIGPGVGGCTRRVGSGGGQVSREQRGGGDRHRPPASGGPDGRTRKRVRATGEAHWRSSEPWVYVFQESFGVGGLKASVVVLAAAGISGLRRPDSLRFPARGNPLRSRERANLSTVQGRAG